MENVVWVGDSRDTPLGSVWVGVNSRGLVAVEIRPESLEQWVLGLGKRLGAATLYEPERVAVFIQQIEAYLSGELRSFSLPIDWSLMTPFKEQVLRATVAILYGETRSYGEIAAQVGRPGAARAVGRAEATNPIPLVIPCHRVIGADGSLRGYGGAGGLETKSWLLQLEGASLQEQRRILEQA